MLSGITAQNGSFLADLNLLESRIGKENKEITSGIRVNQASDDPSSVEPILKTQSELDRVTQVQANLRTATTDATTADQALQSASSVLDQIVSLGTQGANGISTAQTRQALGNQVQELEQQLVSLANTQVNGRYIFGGDNATTQPYTFNWNSAKGVVSNSTSSDTSLIRDAGGDSIVGSQTAQQIFDLSNPDGSPAPGNVFEAAYSLGQALQSNDLTGIQNANASLKQGVAYLGQVSASYGNTETWIQQAGQSAAQELINLQQSLSTLRDADIPSAITQMTVDQSALEASLSAHASLPTKSLFSYLA